MKPPYPVGTLCYVHSGIELRKYAGHLCSVIGYWCRCTEPGVCHVELHDGTIGCAKKWSVLIPIAPPPTPIGTRERQSDGRPVSVGAT